ncbi:transcriptional regulator protein [Beggiatoa sp. PS]|nr:transcriptional regulator protein [Beggiatoa sp. PS]
MIPKNRPTPLGQFIKADILNEFGMTQSQLANALAVSYPDLDQLINEKCRLTADMALRLGKFTKTSPEMWLNLQLAIDLWEAYHSPHAENIAQIQPYVTLAHAI